MLLHPIHILQHVFGRNLVRLFMMLAIATTVIQSAAAQTPQYIKKYQAAYVQGYLCYFNPAPDTTPDQKFQLIYTPRKHFPTAPRGYIKAIYFRTGPYINSAKFNNPGFAYNVQMSMGWTAKDTFRRLSQTNPALRDTFLTGLTTVYSTPVIQQNLKDSAKRWMRFLLPGSGFLYDTTQGLNLVVEVILGPPYPNNYFCLLDSAGGGLQQMLRGYRDTPSVYGTLRDPNVYTGGSVDFGFDLTPLGVEAGTFGGNFSLYPNPSSGSFHISADAVQPLRDVSVTVRSITGQTVFRRQYQPSSVSFSEEIVLPDAAKGMYIVEMLADGERIVRRVLVE
jgi:hypothetical protein